MKKSVETRCVHSGSKMDPETRGLVTPIHPSTSFDYIDTDILAYPRYFNTPNQKAVVEKIASLENGEDGLVLSSGMAAITTILYTILKQGDHAVFQRDLYGGTVNAIIKELNKFGIEYSLVDATDLSSVEEAINDNTRLIYIETPSNPLLKIVDIKGIVSIASNKGITTAIDNTFASPINQNPLDLGIDIVLHSGTKYLGGHSDICCGAIVTTKELTEKLWNTAISMGGSLNAITCYLLERSLKTLALRVNQQNKNAMEIARFLESRNEVSKVFYPGLESHAGHELAASQMTGFGGMLSFELKTDMAECDRFVKSLTIINSAMSLGGVETIISSPAQTSHQKVSAEERKAIGISDSVLRMSVGVEDSGDLITDLTQGLEQIRIVEAAGEGE